MSADSPLFVTRPDLPPLEALLPALQDIWASRQLTNNGPWVRRLEAELCRFLDVPAISLFCNGTVALLAALRALRLGQDFKGGGGEVITTPFSFVASAHVLRWAGLTPVFVDIEPETFTLDARLLEAALTPCTRAILPVHVYGHPCDTVAIDAFAASHGLKVLYDAAHAFGVRTAGQGLLHAGDLSVLSFHATKVFHTFEGGAVICHSVEMKRQIDLLKNFGFEDELTVSALGINGKMSELQAAIGCLQLPQLAQHNAQRAALDALYRQLLTDVPGLLLPPSPNVDAHNYGYFPVRVTARFGCSRDALYLQLRDIGIHARRYFHPLISEFEMYQQAPGAMPQQLPVATAVAQQILCLPLYASLAASDVQRVAYAVRAAAR